MTPAERSAITNGIWLCQRHAGLVDRDVGAYTARVLRDMKTAHERIVPRQVSGITQHASDTDFVAIGSDLVFTGELLSVAGFGWTLRIDHFLIGDLATLISFTERFDQIHPSDRATYWSIPLVTVDVSRRHQRGQRTDSGFVVACNVCESFPRTNVHDLPTDLALDRAHDLTSVNGKTATISGLAALPQTIKINLSVQRGEQFRYPRFGARIKGYFDLFRDSPWLHPATGFRFASRSRSKGSELGNAISPYSSRGRRSTNPTSADRY